MIRLVEASIVTTPFQDIRKQLGQQRSAQDRRAANLPG
jgi:hypothetical protein